MLFAAVADALLDVISIVRVASAVKLIDFGQGGARQAGMASKPPDMKFCE
jgi:hypothetical protein